MTIRPGQVVIDGRRTGRVVCVVRGKALVMWDGSNIAGWNLLRRLKVVF